MKQKIIFAILFFFFLSLCLHVEAQEEKRDSTGFNLKFEEQRINVKAFESLPIISIDELSKEGQEKKYKDYLPDIIPDYFLLGLFHNYFMSNYIRRENLRKEYVEGEFAPNSVQEQILKMSDLETSTRIDHFHNHEKPLVDYLKQYIHEKYNEEVLILTGNREEFNLYSEKMILILKDYFDDNGRLKKDIFNSKEEIYSFISGRYYRYGYRISDYIYKITHVEEILYFLLKEAGCAKILYNSTEYTIGGGERIYFKAPVRLKKYIDSFEMEKEKLNDYPKGPMFQSSGIIDEKEKELIEQVFE